MKVREKEKKYMFGGSVFSSLVVKGKRRWVYWETGDEGDFEFWLGEDVGKWIENSRSRRFYPSFSPPNLIEIGLGRMVTRGRFKLLHAMILG